MKAKNINQHICLKWDEIGQPWTLYKNKIIGREEYTVTCNEILESNYAFENLYRCMCAIDVGIMIGKNQGTDLQDILVARKLNAMTRQEVNKSVNVLAQRSVLKELLEGLIENPLNLEELPKYKHDEETPYETIAFIADTHYNGNKEELEHLLDSLYRKCESQTVIFAGDSIQGYLRISDMTNPTVKPIEQVKEMAEMIVNWLNQDEFVKRVIFLPGNHGEHRLEKGMFGEFNSSFEEILAMLINGHVEQDVFFQKEVELNISGQEVLVTHGDGFKGEKRLREHYAHSKYDKIIYGHYHEFKVDSRFVSLPPSCFGGSFSKSLGHPSSERAFVEISTDWDIVYKKID